VESRSIVAAAGPELPRDFQPITCPVKSGLSLLRRLLHETPSDRTRSPTVPKSLPPIFFRKPQKSSNHGLPTDYSRSHFYSSSSGFEPIRDEFDGKAAHIFRRGQALFLMMPMQLAPTRRDNRETGISRNISWIYRNTNGAFVME
jgi:hypothetical protein